MIRILYFIALVIATLSSTSCLGQGSEGEATVSECFAVKNSPCPDPNSAPCNTTECNHLENGWAEDPTDSNKEIPLFIIQCPDNQMGRIDIATQQSYESFENAVITNGRKQSEVIEYLCFRETFCALGCNATTQVKGTAPKRFKNGSGNAGTITLYFNWCETGAGPIADDVSIDVYNAVGPQIPDCLAEENGGED